MFDFSHDLVGRCDKGIFVCVLLQLKLDREDMAKQLFRSFCLFWETIYITMGKILCAIHLYMLIF